MCGKISLGADCVEKLQNLKIENMRREQMDSENQMGLRARGDRVAQKCRRLNLAEPLASKTASRGKEKNFADFAKNGVFQHNRRKPDLRCGSTVSESAA